MTREEFRDLLRGHDWFFSMSDDPRVYRAGMAAQKTITAHEHDGPGFEADVKEARDWLFSGAPGPMPGWWRSKGRDVEKLSAAPLPDAFRPAKDETCIFE